MDRNGWIITLSIFLASLILLITSSHVFWDSLFASIMTAGLALGTYIIIKWIIQAIRQ